jgi:hypothetical protein
MSKTYTDEQIAFIAELHLLKEYTWSEIADKYNTKFKSDKTATAVERAYQRYGQSVLESSAGSVKMLVQTARTRKSASSVRKENDLLKEQLDFIEDAKDAATRIIKGSKLTKVAKPAITKKDSKKKDMCKELLLSDLHYGKLVRSHDNNSISFNAAIARKRMCYLSNIFVREVLDDGKTFNVTKIILALMGDIIESYTMHGLESAKGCEFNNAEQMVVATQSLFEDLIEPVSKLGIPIVIPCIPGNHDRTGYEKTYNQIGRDYMTFVIYSMLEALCKAKGVTNVEFKITNQSYVILDIFGNKILYHHGDLASRGIGHSKLKNFKRDVEDQVGFKIDGSRSGHTHEYVVYGRGEDIVNGCLVGQDDYAHNKGYSTEASQTINDYVNTNKRRNKFYKSFAVSLENVE